MYNKLKHFTFVFTIFFFISLIGTYALPTQFNNKYIGENKEVKAVAGVDDAIEISVGGAIFVLALSAVALGNISHSMSNGEKIDWGSVGRDCKNKAIELKDDAVFMKNVVIDNTKKEIYMTQTAIQMLKKAYQDATAPNSINITDFDLASRRLPDRYNSYVLNDVSSGCYSITVYDNSKMSVSTTKDTITYNGTDRVYVVLFRANKSYHDTVFHDVNGSATFGNSSPVISSGLLNSSVCADPVSEGVKSLPSTGSVAIPMSKFHEWVKNPPTTIPKDIPAIRQVADKDIPTNVISLQDIKDSITNEGCSTTEEAQENIKPTTDSLTVQRYINGRPVVINQSLQNAHIKGTKAYEADIAKGIARSLLIEDADFLLDYYAGTGYKINDYTELVDFEDTIGQYYDTNTKAFGDTSIGIIIYGIKGAHIVPIKHESKKHKKAEPGTIEKKGTATDYTNKAGNKVRINGKAKNTVKGSIDAKKNNPKNDGEQVEGEVGEYVNSKKDVTSFGDKVKNLTTGENAGDIDVATEDELIEVKKSMSSFKETQIEKYINDEDPNFFNYAKKKVILYVKETIEMNKYNTEIIANLKSKGVEVVNSLEELGRMLK
ncbi:toxin 50 [Clostridium cavendishii DSM 21758]|uniref:Toxin 50 n=1 Tax=Clostridium cavendishii DSM 21758 TaxID=1121302 RepID=A0A1M6NVV0_9CLOT|nr:polymorphic toxin type 50 domain-containing protein [Clostridium cavendishii]SHJ99768.1 toxin 50 [Clostridium cavendishii DSM 21758]